MSENEDWKSTINPNLISLFFPLSALLYGIIENSI